MTCQELFIHEAPTSPVVLADAADLASGAHFEKLGGWAALARFDDDSPPRLLLVNRDSTVSTFEVIADAAPLEIVGIWGFDAAWLSASPAVVFALGCDDTACQLLGAEAGDERLEALPGYELEAAARPEGLVSDRERLCVYGEGLYCLSSDGWSTVIPADVSGRIMAVSLGHPAAAATADGTLFLEDSESGTWSAFPTVVTAPRSLDTTTRTLSVLTAGGDWVVASIEPEATAQCAPSPALLRAIPGSSPFGIPWLVIDEHAAVYRQRQTYSMPPQPDPYLTWCRASDALSETVHDVVAVPCDDGTNLLAITDTRLYSLYGRIACPTF